MTDWGFEGEAVGADGALHVDAGDLAINLPMVLERKKRRLAEHVRQARTVLAGFEQSSVRGGKHYEDRHAQHKHKALKRDLEVVEEEYAILYLLMGLNEASI